MYCASGSRGVLVAAQVVAMTQVLAAMLESSHSVSLTAPLTTELWPSVDGESATATVSVTCTLRLRPADSATAASM